MTSNHYLRDVVAKGHDVQRRHAVTFSDLEAALCRVLHQDAHAGILARQLEHRGEHPIGGRLEQNGREVVPRGQPAPIAPRQDWAAALLAQIRLGRAETRDKRAAFIIFPASTEVTAIVTDVVDDVRCHSPSTEGQSTNSQFLARHLNSTGTCFPPAIAFARGRFLTHWTIQRLG